MWITEVSLALDSDPAWLREVILRRLRLQGTDLLNVSVFKRSYDARKKSSSILFVYIVDVEVRNEAAVLARLASDQNVRPAPDASYHPVAHAPADLSERPLVVGFGPCGIFAALILAQTG